MAIYKFKCRECKRTVTTEIDALWVAQTCPDHKPDNPQAGREAGSECMNLLSAEIGPLVAELAQWERDNGTLACIFGPEQKDEVCKIISDWALTGAMRRCDEWIKRGI